MTARLIIADDSADMRWLVRSTLQRDFPDVVEVEDGRQLFTTLLRSTLASGKGAASDLVLVVDVRMPVYTGLEVLDAWRDRDELLPVVVITSYPDEAVQDEVDRLGALLVPKPFTRATLQHAVAIILRRRGHSA